MGTTAGKMIGKVGQVPEIKVNTRQFPINSECYYNKYNFYFIRHGLSCENIRDMFIKASTNSDFFKKKEIISQTIGEEFIGDPNLCNWGIITCNLLKEEYLKLFSGIPIDNMYCSQFLRTWETAYLLFGDQNIKNFHVAPFIKEVTPFKYVIGTIYNQEKERFKIFVNYLNEMMVNFGIQNNFQIGFPKYNLRKSGAYPAEFSGSNIDEFIKFYIKNKPIFNRSCPNDEVNVIVVCHSKLISDWIKKHNIPTNNLPKRNPNGKGFFYENNGYCLKVSINTSQLSEDFRELDKTSNIGIQSVEIVNQGFPEPTLDQVQELHMTSSKLCETKKERNQGQKWNEAIEKEYNIIMTSKRDPNFKMKLL